MRRSLAVGLCLCALAAPARADDPARRGLDPDPPRPALGLDAQLTTEGARPTPAGSWGLGLELDWVHGLLAVRDGDRLAAWAVRDRLAGHLLGARSFGRLELGAALPIALWQSSGLGALALPGALGAPVARSAVGDLRLSGRLALLGEERAPLSLAAALELRAPTGDGHAFFSDGWGLTPGLLAGRRLGPVRLDASLGWAFRRPGQFLQLVAHDGLAAGAAVSLDLPPRWRLLEWRAIADVALQLPRGTDLSSDRYRAPASARLGVRARVWRSLWVDAGLGTGLATLGNAGYGRESFRVFAGLRWQRIHRDRDGDGVLDDDDRCPDVPGPARWDGCPAPADRDGDGVPDAEDRCPDVPGPRELSGCPDRDGDGVPDVDDRCPTVPGPKELEGCPDQDGDGVPDIDDRCPAVPGPAQNDGCPPAESEPMVEIETTRLSLKDAIHFDTGKDTIRPESSRILDEIAQVLSSRQEIRRVRVEGHTDNVGSRPYNLDLSQRRAAAVVRALTARGIPAARLQPVGYGFDRPVTSNATALGRAKNRRVELTILGESEAAPEPR
jgi:outer membrane protein OmpA-like peptidoglycan-associated protein